MSAWRLAAVLVLAFPLTGCLLFLEWYRDGATAEDFRREQAHCFNEAGYGLIDPQVAETRYGNCMVSLGWYVRPKAWLRN